MNTRITFILFFLSTYLFAQESSNMQTITTIWKAEKKVQQKK
ncbi:hypothetical protein [Aquimarina sediminis]|nr:hypothetical protein [Aquimarina sediminis]